MKERVVAKKMKTCFAKNVWGVYVDGELRYGKQAGLFRSDAIRMVKQIRKKLAEKENK